MKNKSLLLALALLTTGFLAAQLPVGRNITLAVDVLLDHAASNRNTARALAPLSDYAAGYFQGKAAALEEIAATGTR